MLCQRLWPAAVGGSIALGMLAVVTAVMPTASQAAGMADPLDTEAGICVVVGLPDPDSPGSLAQLCSGNRRLVYFQSADFAQVMAVRAAAAEAGVLGSQVFVEHGGLQSVHLADNLADRVWVTPAAVESISRPEILRVLQPGGKAIVGTEELIKPQPEGVDQWSHLYHGPDNNPSSTDQVARAPFRTQFLAVHSFRRCRK